MKSRETLPRLLKFAQQVCAQRASLQASQPVLPPDSRQRRFGAKISLVERRLRPLLSAYLVDEGCQPLHCSKLHPRNGLLVPPESVGSLLVAQAQVKQQLQYLNILQFLPFAQLRDQPPQ